MEMRHTGLSPYDTSSNTGALKWKYQTGGDVESSSATGSNGTVYVGSDDAYLYAINPDGTLKWSYTTGGWVISSPAIGAMEVFMWGPTMENCMRLVVVPVPLALLAFFPRQSFG